MNKNSTSPAYDKRYWAFISYSHADTKEAEWLHKALEGFKIPTPLIGTESRNGIVPRRIFPVFRDRDELPTSADLGANLHAALRNSRYLVVICSPNSAKSIWVNAEVEFFKKTHGNSNVLCLIVGGAPGGSGEGESAECFCPALRHHINSDGSAGEPAEPIAADLRDAKDGRLRAFLKIVAGILGVDFDALYQREKRRQRKRALGFAAAAAILAAIGLVFYQRLDSVARSQSEVASEVKKMREMKFRAFGELPEERAAALSSIIDDSGVTDAEQALDKALASEKLRYKRYNERLDDFIKHRQALVDKVEAFIDIIRPQIGWADAANILRAAHADANAGASKVVSNNPEEIFLQQLDADLMVTFAIAQGPMRGGPPLDSATASKLQIWIDALGISAPFLDHLDGALSLTAEMTNIVNILPTDLEIGSTETQSGQDLRLEYANKLNSAAWLLATDPDPSLRDPEKAMAFSQKATHLTAEKNSPVLETLAASYAVAGDFDSALHWQTLAVERGGSCSPAERSGFVERLGLYKNRQAYTKENSHGMTLEDVSLCIAPPDGLYAWAADQWNILEKLEVVLATFPVTPEEKVVVDAELQRLKDLQVRLENDGSRKLNDLRRKYNQSKADAMELGGSSGYVPIPKLDGVVPLSERVWRKPLASSERSSADDILITSLDLDGDRANIQVDRESSVELYCISRFVFAEVQTDNSYGFSFDTYNLAKKEIIITRDFARAAAQFLGVRLQ